MTFCCCLGWRFERFARFEGCRVCLEIFLPDPCPAVTRASSLGTPSPEETSSAVASKGPVCCCQRKGLIMNKILNFQCNFSFKRKRDAAFQNFCWLTFKKSFALLFDRDIMRAFIFWQDQILKYVHLNWLVVYLYLSRGPGLLEYDRLLLGDPMGDRLTGESGRPLYRPLSLS